MTESSDRVWFVTGASSGFGRQIAETALRAGDRVVATARRHQALDELAATAPDRVLAIALDVTDSNSIPPAVQQAIDRFGRIDVLVNNAGFASVGAVEEIEPDHLRLVMETMFFGAVWLTQAVLPHFRQRGDGTVVQISSMGGQVTMPGFGAYCSAKYALESMSEALAAEVAPLGIRVLIVEPGAFRTSFGGAGVHRSPRLSAYDGTVGPTRDGLDHMDGTQKGDPRKAAEAIRIAVDADDPPLHLALGDDAVDNIRAQHDRLRADLDGWEELSRSTAIDG